jgi:hypothetical protein
MDGRKLVSDGQIAAVRTAIGMIAAKKPTGTSKQLVTSDYCVVSAAEAYNTALKEISKRPNIRFRGFTLHLKYPTGEYAAIEIADNVMLDNVTITAEEPTSKGVLIDCTSCTIVVFGGSFEHLTQQLDFATWFRCRFVNCTISYMGGRFIMVRCEFEDCEFEFSPSTTPELKRMIESGTAASPIPSTLQ